MAGVRRVLAPASNPRRRIRAPSRSRSIWARAALAARIQQGAHHHPVPGGTSWRGTHRPRAHDGVRSGSLHAIVRPWRAVRMSIGVVPERCVLDAGWGLQALGNAGGAMATASTFPRLRCASSQAYICTRTAERPAQPTSDDGAKSSASSYPARSVVVEDVQQRPALVPRTHNSQAIYARAPSESDARHISIAATGYHQPSGA